MFGDAGGGTALIGGDEHGSNPAVANADQTYLGPDATITADALTLGTGGKVILWATRRRRPTAHRRSRRRSGWQRRLRRNQRRKPRCPTTPNLSRPRKGGTWLLDPAEVEIVDNQSSSGAFSSPFTKPRYIYAETGRSPYRFAISSVTITASTSNGGAGTINWTQPAWRRSISATFRRECPDTQCSGAANT